MNVRKNTLRTAFLAITSLLLVVVTHGYGKDKKGLLGKVFQGNKTMKPASGNVGGGTVAPERVTTGAVATEPTSTQNAFRAVGSNGKIVNQVPGTVAPPRRITPAKPSASKPGEYRPVPSSALATSALDKPSRAAADAAKPFRPVTKKSGPSKFGKKNNGAYRPVSSNGSVVTGVVSAPAATTPSAPVIADSRSKTKDWTQKRQNVLPPMPKLFDPTKQTASATPVAVGNENGNQSAPSAVSSVVQTAPRESTMKSSRMHQPSAQPEFSADPRAAAEIQAILAEEPPTKASRVAKVDAPRQPKPVAEATTVSAAPKKMANRGGQGSGQFAASTSASDQYVGQVTPTEDLEDASTTMQRFPAIDLPETKKSIAEQNVDWLIDQVASAYSDTLGAINGQDVSLDVGSLPSVPSDFGSDWGKKVRSKVWAKYGTVKKTLQGTYSSALQHSHQVKAFSSIPLIRETGIQEAQGAFDWTAFLEGRYAHTDEPTSSILTTGEIGRFEQDMWQGEYGLRKRLKTGTEVSLSNRLSTLDNNSEFLQPNAQTGSELVVSITQPLLQGAGYHYNTTSIKVAKLDAKLGAAEYLRQLEGYLLEVNRTYWGVYLARAGYLQRKSLVARTKSIVSELEDRKGVDAEATASELLRAKSALAQRQASLIRSEMSIRLAEERLRAMVNDPGFALGSSKELVPTTAPILSAPNEDVREVAKAAIRNRPELLQGFYQVQAAGLRRDLQKNELLPTLNLILEGTVAGLDANRDLGGAFSDQFRHGEGWLAGFTFEVPLERNFAKARHQRRRHELRQQLNTLRGTVDSVALEAIVAYRELQTSYRDMQAKYLAATATREELKELEQRRDVDAGGKGGTVGYQLQLILDAIDRNQRSEEAFLVSVVVYNTAFTTLDKARGTLLRRNDVQVQRGAEDGLDTISSQIGGDGKGVTEPSGKGVVGSGSK